MTFFTRPELDDNVLKQLSGNTLTLSGQTDFVGTLKSKGVEIDASATNAFEGYVLTLDSTGVIKLKSSSSGGTGLYEGASPSTVPIGGIPAGTVLTNRTYESLWEQLLVVYQEPSFTSFSLNIASLNEVGNPSSFLGNKIFTWDTNNKSNVNPESIEIFDVTNNISLAMGLANDNTETIPLNTVITNTSPISHTWRISGLNTKSNTITPRTKTIKSIYPWFYGTFNAGAVAAGSNRPDPSQDTIAQQLINSGFSEIKYSDSTVIAEFNSTTEDYLWVAIPTTSTIKTVWFVTELSNGLISGQVSAGGNLFPTPVNAIINSPDGYWSDISYRIYLSNKQVAVNKMEFRNT